MTEFVSDYWKNRALKAENAFDQLRKSIRRELNWAKRNEVGVVGKRCNAATCGFRTEPPMVKSSIKGLVDRLETKLSRAVDRSIRIMRSDDEGEGAESNGKT